MMGYLRYLPKMELYKKSKVTIKLGDNIDIHKLVNKLYDLGYTRESVVNKTGEIAVRGFVVDIFPINYDRPIRIEFWGDTVDSIRYFNVDSQMSAENVKEILIFSYTEFLSEKQAPFEYRLQKNLKDYTSVVGIVDYLKEKNVVFDEVLMLDGNFGSPKVDGAKVTGKVVKHGKGKKIRIFKYVNKSKSTRKSQGHRQPYTKVEITKING